MKIAYLASVVAGLGLVFAGQQAVAQDFSGKTIELIVPAGAGGGLSRQAQRFAKTFTDHIPGNPTIKVRNIVGGGGQKGINFVYNRAKKDGTQMMWGPLNFVGILTGLKGVKYDPAKFNAVGVIGISFVTIARSDLLGGMKHREDIVKAGNFNVGARIPGGGLGMYSRFGFDMLGIPYRFIVGYKNQPKLKAGLMQNEIQVISTGDIGYWVFYRDDLLKKGTATDLYYHAPYNAATDSFVDLGYAYGNLPSFVDFYKKVKGKAPSGPMYEAYKWYLTYQVWSMWMLLPPGTPESIVSTLRQAYTATWADERTMNAFLKASKTRPIWQQGDKVGNILTGYKNVDPAALDYMRTIMR